MINRTKRKLATKAPAAIEVPLRVTLRRPPAGVQYCLGRTDDGEIHEPKISRGRDLFFDLVLRARPGKDATSVNFTGEHAHGTPTTRFIPIGVGTLAGQTDSCWTRVVKISLAGISPKMVRDVTARAGSRLEVGVEGSHKCGAPVCATVSLLDGGWQIR